MTDNHQGLVLDQFTRQARLFSTAAPITNADALQMIVAAARPGPRDNLLDVACGEGYGSALLCQVASSVLGIDSAQDAIEHARRSYTAANLRFSCGDARCIEAENRESRPSM